MLEDSEGFLYPKVDADSCIECGLCEKVCPVINQAEPQTPLHTYAAKSRNLEVISKSSSGGVFSLLAERVIEKGGVVFGAKFSAEWEVIHASAQGVDEIAPMRGSKYLQSQIGDTFSETLTYLKEGREVLFSGTPCQIAGLKGFLGKEYNNLTTIDIICHGTPSPKVWRQYLDHTFDRSKIVGINFRDKIHSCQRYNFTVETTQGRVSEKASKNLYMRGFLKNIYLRPSCHHCPTKELKAGSDITLADFWGIERVAAEFNNPRGVGLVMANSAKGEELMQSIDAELHEVDYLAAISGNPSMQSSAKAHARRAEFFESIDSNMVAKLKELLHVPLHKRIATKIKRAIIKFTPRCIVDYLHRIKSEE